ncbi:MAG: hypothetical protein ACFFAN_21150 [Promethearchaeota archaeon]
MEICWSDPKTRKREDDWIIYFREESPSKILNTYKGGGGGHRVSIPKSLLIPYIAKGFWQKEILRTLKTQYNIQITIWSLYDRISGYFPADDGLSSMQIARKEILKPIFKYLMKNGYTTEYLGCCVYNRSKKTISRWSQEFWQIRFQDKQNELFKEFLKDLIIQGLEYREIDEKVKGMPWPTISGYITKWWGGLKPAREELMKPLIADGLIADYDYNQISKILGHDSIERLRKYISIFWKIPSNVKGDWTHIDKFISYVRTKNLSKDGIMYISYDQIFK